MNREPPSTYLEWVRYLELLQDEENIEEIISTMECGKLEWTSGVAERFTQRLCSVIELKLNETSVKLQHDLQNSESSEIHLGHALILARRKNEIVERIASLEVLPDEVKKLIHNMVITSISHMQESLMRSAKTDKSGRLLKIIKEIGVIPKETTGLPKNDEFEGETPVRRVLFK